MENTDADSLPLQLIGQSVSRSFRANKNQRATAFIAEQALQQRELLVHLYFVGRQIDGFGGLLSRTKGQADRVAHVIMDEVLHRSFKRCREAQSLTGLGQPRNNPADSGNKS